MKKGLPLRFHSARLENFSQQVQVAVLRWLNNPHDGLLINGPAGTGKTHLAAAIVRWRIENKQHAAFRRLSEFYSALRESFGAKTSEKAVMEPLLVHPFVALDDLGAGGLSDHERRSTLEVLDRRCNSLLPTVITTNWSLSEIAERIDDRIASRLASFVNIELAGEDRRLHSPGQKALKIITTFAP